MNKTDATVNLIKGKLDITIQNTSEARVLRKKKNEIGGIVQMSGAGQENIRHLQQVISLKGSTAFKVSNKV